jgi:hypothetical protein
MYRGGIGGIHPPIKYTVFEQYIFIVLPGQYNTMVVENHVLVRPLQYMVLANMIHVLFVSALVAVEADFLVVLCSR